MISLSRWAEATKGHCQLPGWLSPPSRRAIFRSQRSLPSSQQRNALEPAILSRSDVALAQVPDRYWITPLLFPRN
ncbi:hypothetical protein WJX84_010558 [Apatococcus fuscideae]|uniref:Uncharacterized protein n=1 Tax=Apatococcus fuscideae TaxID=2026836 RepID=A0AAW1S270_9CHLO